MLTMVFRTVDHHGVEIAALQRTDEIGPQLVKTHFADAVSLQGFLQFIPVPTEIDVDIIITLVFLAEVQLYPGRVLDARFADQGLEDCSPLQQIEGFLKSDATAFIDIKGLPPILVRLARI